MPVPTGGLPGSDKSKDYTIEVNVTGGTPGFAAGWLFPGGTAPNISTTGRHTLYGRTWNDGGTTYHRIVGHIAWS